MKVMVDPAFPDHRKVAALAELLKVDEGAAVGYVVTLWCRAMSLAPSGNLEGWTDAYIARSAKWSKSPALFTSSLMKACLLVGSEGKRIIKDWVDWQGDILEKRETWKAQQAARRSKKCLQSVSGDTKESLHVVSTSVPSRTVPVPPVPSPSVPLEVATQPPPSPDGARSALASLLDLWNHGREARTWIRETPGRLAKVKARLGDFTLEQLRKAVANIKQSEWHNGGNDRGWKAPGPEWVLHTRERTEQWINWEKPKTSEEKLMDWAHERDRKLGLDKIEGNGHA